MSFDAAMYERIREGCQSSAAEVVPFLYRIFTPETVIDYGGGEGWWGSEFRKHGAKRALVIDREYPQVRAPDIEFIQSDIPTERRTFSGFFDLVICLEVAEHLPPELADDLVQDLCGYGSPIVFSAATPGQGGHGHLNEQWPSYWVERFDKHDFAVSGGIRWAIWDNPKIEPWYRQNLLLCSPRSNEDVMKLRLFQRRGMNKPHAVRHPAIEHEWHLVELEGGSL